MMLETIGFKLFELYIMELNLKKKLLFNLSIIDLKMKILNIIIDHVFN